MKESLSIFFPAYGDEKTIPILVEKAIKNIKKLRIKDFEIIVVDDGSPDNVGEVIDKLAKKYKFFKAIHHKKNKGYGGALKSGIANSSKQWVFYTDGDAQYDVDEFPKLWANRNKGDIINGYNLKRGDQWYRALIGNIYFYGAKLIFGLKTKQIDCDFRLMKNKIFDKVKLKSNEGFICIEMMKKIQDAGFKFYELPVKHYPRIEGKSTFFTPMRIIKTLWNFFKFRIQLFFE